MARYAITILAIAAIILAAVGSAGAASPQEPRELTVLAYNTHLFEDSPAECLCRCAYYMLNKSCYWSWYAYDDAIRREEIADKVETSGADIVVLQEVWANGWQEYFVTDLSSTYPYAEIWASQSTCIADMPNWCFTWCGSSKNTLGSGLVLLSKFPLDSIDFERFPTFEQCPIDKVCEAWADKGVLTADVNVGGVTIRIGVSHALGMPHDRSKWDTNYIGTAITPFQLKGEPYIFALDSGNKGHIVRMEDHGRWWDEKNRKYNRGAGWKHLHAGPWGSDYDVVTSFELDGHPYLFRLSNDANHAFIFRINDDPSTGWTSMCDYDWYSTDVVAVESFELDGHPFLLALNENGQARIDRIIDDPCMTWQEVYQGLWSPNDIDYVETAITSFQLDGDPHIFTLARSGRAYINRINDDPCTGWIHAHEGDWGCYYDIVTSFELDGHPYLFGLYHNKILRINDDAFQGWTLMYQGTPDINSTDLIAWYRFENNTDDSSDSGPNSTPIGNPTYSVDSQEGTYSINLDGVDDYVIVGPVGVEGNSPRTIAGWVKATKSAAQIPGYAGIFGFTWDTGDNTHFNMERRFGVGHDYYCINVYGWVENVAPLDQEWHHLAATYDGNEITWYAEGSLVGSAARDLSTIDNVQIGKRFDKNPCFPGLIDDVRIYSSALSQGEIAQLGGLGYIAVQSFEMNGHPHLFALRNCCDQLIDSPYCRPRPGEVYLKRINDDPCTGWEDLYQLEDIRIIRDQTVVDEGGPPAIMMGDFNIHEDKYGIMNELFGKAGAVDAYIEVHGSDIGGETGDFGNNKLAQYFCNGVSPPDDPDFCDPENHPPDRVNYVYVRQSGASLRLVPTEAQVIRDWKYYSPDADDFWDLSDHFPLFVKFQIFEGGCTAREKGDLNCDRLINFADLAILGSAWMAGPNDISWDGACDISDPADDFIDTKDVDAFAQAWLSAPPVHNVTQDKWYEFIQTAITYAQDGDEIAVAPGTYYEAINFKNRAIRLYSSGGPEVTTINGTGHYHVVKCVNGEGPGTILEGFTITGGNANGGWPDNYGGGMYNQQSSPTVTSCIFTGNSATFGAGMYNNNNSSPTVTDCNFTGNSATSGGGGMYNYQNSNPTVANCTFTGNTASPGTYGGGGMYNDQSSPTMTNCTFSGNSAVVGGAMENRAGSEPNLTNCVFSNNSATDNGGGMNNYDSNPTLTNCTFTDNSANYGGGMYNYNSSPLMTGCNFNDNESTEDGGGMYNYQSSPTVTDCNFSDNTADTDGGGMYNNYDSYPTLIDSNFNGNKATENGGGIYVYSGAPSLTNCIFSGNSAIRGGGMYRWNPAYLTNCTFHDNTASYGGGMYNFENYTCLLTDCNFIGNGATVDGGGMYNDQSSPTVTDCTFGNNMATSGGGGGMRNRISSPTVTNCSFTGNSAQHAGGMFNDNGSNPAVTNCIFSSNSAADIGGGMFNLTNSSPTVINCTFSGNSAVSGGGGMDNRVSSDPNVTNCILWGNEPDEIYNYSASPIITYSDIQDGTGQSWFDTGCIDSDPCFVDADNPDPNLWNLRLKPDSLCIDAGNNNAVPIGITTDLDGNDRVWNGTVDMGAYEYLNPPPPISSAGNFEYLAMICADWLAGTKPEL